MLRNCATVAAWSCSKEDQERMREQFLALGMDENGALTSKVFTQAMQSANVGVSEAEDLFRCLDLDGDGMITAKDLRVLLGKSLFKKHNVEDWLLEVGDCSGGISFEMFSVLMRQCHRLLEEVNVTCIVSDVGVSDSRSVSMTSVQSQDQEKSLQKV